MRQSNLKVVFIAGGGRSGSTLLLNILGQISGFFSIGELQWFWGQVEAENKYCSCEQLILECETWQAIFDTAFGGISQVDIREMLQSRRSLRERDLPFLWLPGVRQKHETMLENYVEAIQKMYFGIREVTGSRVIVDSSKLPTYGVILQMIPGIELHVLHLVRDSRAVAFSWQRKKSFVPESYAPDFMVQRSPAASAVEWMVRNINTESHLKKSVAIYSRLLYEDMVSNPENSLRTVLDSFNEMDVELPFVSENRVDLRKQLHTLAGNVVRFQTGEVELTLDEAWKEKMNPASKILVSAITAPLLLRYKYPMVVNNL
jgi:hypothetical protein